MSTDPVAWQNRYRSRNRPSEEWSEWSEWRDGKQSELRTKAEDGGCYDTEERPLYTRPDHDEDQAMIEQQFAEYVERVGDDLQYWKDRAEAAEKERDMLKAALERRGEVVFGREGD